MPNDTGFALSSADGAYSKSPVKDATARGVYWTLKHLTVGPLLNFRMKGDVVNSDVFDRVQGAVIASNHQAFIDHFLLSLKVKRVVRFWAKADWWGTGLKAQLQGFFFAVLNQVPVDRSGGGGGERAIQLAADCVSAGELFAIYPEGTRSKDGRLYKGRTGAVRVAVEGRVPVVPSAILGTGILQPGKRFIPAAGRYKLLFGEPIDVSRAYGKAEDSALIRELTDEVMDAIARLGNLEYVDEYARKRVGGSDHH
jgi:1-acyl-sn-glycerol-3-phosphate acyltransferase